MENLTPPANGKNAPDEAPPAAPVQPDQVQPEPLRPDQCRHQQPGTGTGSRPPPPTICTGTHPAQQIAPPVQTEGQSSSAPRAAALAFFFCPSSAPAACPVCQISSPARAGRCAAAVTMTTPAHRSRSRSHRLPPAPGRISTASAAPDDPAAHQLHRLPIACTPAPPDLTAAASTHRLHPSAAAHPAALPPACRSGSAPSTTAKRPKTSPPRPAAGGVRFFT